MFKKQGVFKATLFLGGARASGQLLSILQFAYFISIFGATETTDSMIIAQTLPFFAAVLFNQGISHTFIPLFTELKEKNSEQEAWKFASALIMHTVVILAAFSALLSFFSPYIVKVLAPGFGEESHKLSADIFRFLCIYMVFSGISGIPKSLFFIYRSFAVPALNSLVLGAVNISAMYLLHQSFGIYSLVAGMITGSFIQTALLFILLNRGEKKLGFQLIFWHKYVKKCFKLTGPHFLILIIARINLIVDHMFASFLGNAFVSSLKYGQVICSAPLNLINMSFGTAVFPALASDASAGNTENLKRKMELYIRLLITAVIPVIVIYFLLGDRIIELFFKRGAFNEKTIGMFYTALVGYCFGVPALAAGSILRMGFFAIKDTVTPLKIGIIAFFSNIVFDAALIKYFSIGGLAFSTSCVQWVEFFFLYFLFQKKYSLLSFRNIFFPVGKIFVSGFFMALAAGVGENLLFSDTNEPDFLINIFLLGVVSSAGIFVYTLSCLLMGVTEIRMILKRFGRIFIR